MGVHRLQVTQRVPVPLDEAWEFFSNPRNLELITPPWLAMELTSEPPPEMYPGLFITYRIRPLLGIPMTWVTEITHVRDREFFVDEQRTGPYRLWHHEHHFRALEDGTTEMRDIVHWMVPFGPLGDIINRLTVRKRVRSIFVHRKQVLLDRFGEADLRGASEDAI